MYTYLKNGQVTTDPRLNRIVQFDERSRDYPVRALITATSPRSYTWSCTTHLDQGREGSCTGHAFAHELAAVPVAVRGVTHKFAEQSIYWQAQKTDQWPGGEYPGASPVYSGTSVLAAANVVKKLGFYKEYRWAFGIDDLIMAVGHQGPAVLGINWYDGMFDVDGEGYVNVKGLIAGGHAILCKGVNITEKYFTLHNSWGPDWGIGGDARISFSDMGRLLKENGEAVIPTVRANAVVSSLAMIWSNIFGPADITVK